MAVKQVVEWLLADSDIVTYVGARVRPVVLAEDDVMPAISVHTISDSPFNTLEGSAGLDLVAVIVNYWSLTHSEAQALKSAGRACLEASGVVMLDETEDYDSAVRQYRVSQQWNVFV